MFDHLDGDCDGKLTYQDFTNLAEAFKTGEDISSISSFYTGLSHNDPYV